MRAICDKKEAFRLNVMVYPVGKTVFRLKEGPPGYFQKNTSDAMTFSCKPESEFSEFENEQNF